MYAIRTVGLTKSYGNHRALSNLNLQVEEGDLFGFIGPNGAGKTTTIRLLMGLLQPTDGEASIFGMTCGSRARDIHRQVGYLSGDVMLPEWMATRDACRMLSLAYKRNLANDFAALCERFKLPDSVRVRDMSRGMRQKLGLIMVLAPNPGLLILDEPTTALDPLTRDSLCDLLREKSNQGHTVFFSSHVLSEVSDLCRNVAVIRKGQLVADEALTTLRARARRQCILVWDGPPPPLPHFLEVSCQQGQQWTAWLNAEPPTLLEWLHGKNLADMTLGPPDLDRLFREYYVDEEAS